MTTLYNCHTEGHGYRITKFDTLGNVESSYSCTKEICECPAGHRHTCRHREMLKIFLRQKAVDTHQFYNYDRGEWVTNEPETPATIEPVTLHDEPAVIITKPEPTPTPFKRRI